LAESEVSKPNDVCVWGGRHNRTNVAWDERY